MPPVPARNSACIPPLLTLFAGVLEARQRKSAEVHALPTAAE